MTEPCSTTPWSGSVQRSLTETHISTTTCPSCLQVELEVVGEFADVQGLDAPREVQLPVGAPVHIQQPVTFVQRVAVSATLEVYRQVVVRLPGQAPGESMLLIVEPRVVSESP